MNDSRNERDPIKEFHQDSQSVGGRAMGMLSAGYTEAEVIDELKITPEILRSALKRARVHKREVI